MGCAGSSHTKDEESSRGSKNTGSGAPPGPSSIDHAQPRTDGPDRSQRARAEQSAGPGQRAPSSSSQAPVREEGGGQLPPGHVLSPSDVSAAKEKTHVDQQDEETLRKYLKGILGPTPAAAQRAGNNHSASASDKGAGAGPSGSGAVPSDGKASSSSSSKPKRPSSSGPAAPGAARGAIYKGRGRGKSPSGRLPSIPDDVLRNAGKQIVEWTGESKEALKELTPQQQQFVSHLVKVKWSPFAGAGSDLPLVPDGPDDLPQQAPSSPPKPVKQHFTHAKAAELLEKVGQRHRNMLPRPAPSGSSAGNVPPSAAAASGSAPAAPAAQDPSPAGKADQPKQNAKPEAEQQAGAVAAAGSSDPAAASAAPAPVESSADAPTAATPAVPNQHPEIEES